MKKILIVAIILLTGLILVWVTRSLTPKESHQITDFTVACRPTTGKIDQKVFGIGSVGADVEIFNIVQDLGVKWLRLDIPWTDIEPAEGTFKWAGVDLGMRELEKRNIGLLAIINHPPDWVWGRDTTLAQNAAKSFGKAIAARYKGRIKYYEAFNEPNLPGFGFFREGERVNVKTYVAYLSGLNAGIREADPAALIVLGGLSSDENNISRKQFIAELSQNGAGDCFDIFAFHPYGYEDGYLDSLHSELKETIKSLGLEKPIWFNELGTSDDSKRAEILKGLSNQISNIPGFFWFSVRDLSPRERYGLVTLDNQKKEPDYSLFKAIVQFVD
ncbi:MAG: cellulase family glycosylhydrolase [bacterium]|nr:cellulase family glycosylhydrolase [bacterium]